MTTTLGQINLFVADMSATTQELTETMHQLQMQCTHSGPTSVCAGGHLCVFAFVRAHADDDWPPDAALRPQVCERVRACACVRRRRTLCVNGFDHSSRKSSR